MYPPASLNEYLTHLIVGAEIYAMPNFTDSRPDLRTLLGLIDVIRSVIKLLEKRRSAINWEQYKLRLLRKEITLRLYNSNIELGEVLDKLRSLCGSLDEKATSERNAWQAVREAKSGVVQDCEAALCQRVLSKIPPLRNESTYFYH